MVQVSKFLGGSAHRFSVFFCSFRAFLIIVIRRGGNQAGFLVDLNPPRGGLGMAQFFKLRFECLFNKGRLLSLLWE